MKLVDAADGKILGTSTFLSGDDFTKIPYILNWDDLATENNTGNGTVATLKYEVLAEKGEATVEIAVNQKSTYNINLEDVVFAAVNGAVQIGEASEQIDDDMNGDGTVSVADAVLLARFIAEDESLSNDQIDKILHAKPDQDNDGFITILDVAMLLKKLSES
ncbi:MAG: dockerin type I repeat-containing protein [Oscillospiraceae bacterium]|nr:dockerin type I repeat-containing protein [Oscillospiraceae bacterium]